MIQAMDVATAYNQIRDFSEQQHDVDRSLLASLGEIFLKHQVHESFGVTLLHRHENLLSGCVMVHTLTPERADLCTMQRWGERELYPSSFFMDSHDCFVPFEFSIASCPEPDAHFLSELRSYFTSHNLAQLLGITRIIPSEKLWIERGLLGGGTIATECTKFDSSAVDTSWRFLDDCGVPRIKTLQKCETPPLGGHRVVEA